MLNVQPAEITYLDDDQKNVSVAASLGIDARLYNNIDDVRNVP